MRERRENKWGEWEGEERRIPGTHDMFLEENTERRVDPKQVRAEASEWEERKREREQSRARESFRSTFSTLFSRLLKWRTVTESSER